MRLRVRPAGAPLEPRLEKGFVYSDGWVQDARLVVINAMDAAERGAAILPHTRLVHAWRGAQHWEATLRSVIDGEERSVKARCIVNAADPWATEVLCVALELTPKRSLRMAKGSHIVVRRLFDHDYACILQNPDKRVVFAIPYESDYTLIGTTDVDYHGDQALVAITDEEVSYPCDVVGRYFVRPVTPAGVVWAYSGVRPLLEDEADELHAVTRDYVLERDADEGNAPLLSVFGGRVTTYRRLAEGVLSALQGLLGNARPTGRRMHRCRGRHRQRRFHRLPARVATPPPWLPAQLAQRYARA